MPRYRRRSSVVTAEQFEPENPPSYVSRSNSGAYTAQTLSGPFKVNPGDWIITQGDLRFVIRPELFQQMYEPVE